MTSDKSDVVGVTTFCPPATPPHHIVHSSGWHPASCVWVTRCGRTDSRALGREGWRISRNSADGACVSVASDQARPRPEKIRRARKGKGINLVRRDRLLGLFRVAGATPANRTLPGDRRSWCGSARIPAAAPGCPQQSGVKWGHRPRVVCLSGAQSESVTVRRRLAVSIAPLSNKTNTTGRFQQPDFFGNRDGESTRPDYIRYGS